MSEGGNERERDIIFTVRTVSILNGVPTLTTSQYKRWSIHVGYIYVSLVNK